MNPCPLCGHRSHPALILTCAVFLALLTSAGWVWMRGSDAPRQEELTQLRERVAALEARGQGTVIFHFPEAKGTPYVNVDQKGWDLAIPTPAPTTNGKRTPTASTPSKSETLKTR